MSPLDAKVSRPLMGGPSFSLRNRLYRGAWKIVWLLLASWTPNFMGPWRKLLLEIFGARMGKSADVRATARVWSPENLIMSDHTLIADGVDVYNMAIIELHEWAIVSQRTTLCAGTHNYSDLNMQLVAKPIRIESRCWVCAEAFVGPGVTIKQGAVLGARAVAFRDLEPWSVYSGNPAVLLKGRRMESAG
nr:putative colanic acid biosynthesis acetyltransferase [Methylosinus sp. R-45379]